MAYLVLSDESRQQLEHERSRLINERDAIVQAVTAEIDRTLQNLNALLDIEPPHSDSSQASSVPVSRKGRPKGQKKSTVTNSSALSSSVVPARQKDASDQKPSRGRTKRKAQVFDAKALKREFKGMAALQAMVRVMAIAPLDQTFSTDDMIQGVYGTFENMELSHARKSVAGVLARGVRQGLLEKVQNTPARFKLNTRALATIESPSDESHSDSQSA
jgi:hypothetical protein